MYSRIFCFSLLYFTCVKDWKCLVVVESINVNVSEQKLFMPHEEKHTHCKYITNQTKTHLHSHIILYLSGHDVVKLTVLYILRSSETYCEIHQSIEVPKSQYFCFFVFWIGYLKLMEIFSCFSLGARGSAPVESNVYSVDCLDPMKSKWEFCGF